MISIVCQPLPEGELPKAAISRLGEPEDVVRQLDRSKMYDVSGRAAMRAAVEATRLEAAWSVFDLRSTGARGRVHMLDHWQLGDIQRVRTGFLVLASIKLVTARGADGRYCFTDEGVAFVTS